MDSKTWLKRHDIVTWSHMEPHRAPEARRRHDAPRLVKLVVLHLADAVADADDDDGFSTRLLHRGDRTKRGPAVVVAFVGAVASCF